MDNQEELVVLTDVALITTIVQRGTAESVVQAGRRTGSGGQHGFFRHRRDHQRL